VRLLAIARAGVIYAEGKGGTVREIFQDACQNYCRTYRKSKSPMVLLGKDYWDPEEMVYDKPETDKRKKVYPVLKKLATEKNFFDYIESALYKMPMFRAQGRRCEGLNIPCTITRRLGPQDSLNISHAGWRRPSA
jgi:hypothetical protein